MRQGVEAESIREQRWYAGGVIDVIELGTAVAIGVQKHRMERVPSRMTEEGVVTEIVLPGRLPVALVRQRVREWGATRFVVRVRAGSYCCKVNELRVLQR